MRMLAVVCPMCGKDEPEMLFGARDRLGLSAEVFTLVRCASCGLVYLNPRPADDELAACYPKEYWGGRVKGPGELVRSIEEKLKERYKLRALARADIGPCRVLDIGCGRGEFLALLRDGGFKVTGIEPGAVAAERGRAEFGLDIITGTMDDVRLPDGGYDLVTMWHVLEHFPDPAGALSAVHKALAPGGKLVLAVPDFGGWQAGEFRQDWFGVDAPRHLTHFTKKTLTAMLGMEGFSVLQVFPCGARYETGMLVRSVFPGLNRKKLDALERGEPARYLYKAAQLMLDVLLVPAGMGILAAGAGAAMTLVAVKGKKQAEGQVY